MVDCIGDSMEISEKLIETLKNSWLYKLIKRFSVISIRDDEIKNANLK